LGEKTRAEGTIANAARERKRNCPKNAGKTQFLITGCGNRGHFSGFPSPEPPQRALAILLACGSAKRDTGDQRMKAACRELEENISAEVKLPHQLDAADFRYADGSRRHPSAGDAKNLRQVCG